MVIGIFSLFRRGEILHKVLFVHIGFQRFEHHCGTICEAFGVKDVNKLILIVSRFMSSRQTGNSTHSLHDSVLVKPIGRLRQAFVRWGPTRAISGTEQISLPFQKWLNTRPPLLGSCVFLVLILAGVHGLDSGGNRVWFGHEMEVETF